MAKKQLFRVKFTVSTQIHELTPEEVYRVFNYDLLWALSPPFAKPRAVLYEGNRPGHRMVFGLVTPLGTKHWAGRVTEEGHTANEIYFVDEGEQMPFGLRLWRHKHRMIRNGAGTLLRDEVRFETRNPLFTALLFPVLYAQFIYRKPRYEKCIRRLLAGHKA